MNYASSINYPKELIAHPEYSIWINASAGTGKTTQLVRRYLGLLLYGYHPSNILCITFTKNACSEMEGRIIETLKDWKYKPENELKQSLHETLQVEITDKILSKSKELFDRFCHEELNIQTIHAFCYGVLCKLIPDFQEKTILEDSCRKIYIEQALEETLKDNMIPSIITRQFSYGHFLELLAELFQKPDILKKSNLHIKTKETLNNVGEFQSILDFSILEKIKESKIFSIINRWINHKDNQNDYFDLFLTQDKQIRNRVIEAKIQKKYPEIETNLSKEASNIFNFQQHIMLEKWINLNYDFFEFAKNIYLKYEIIKTDHKLFEMNDLVFITQNLLNDHEKLYMATKGIQHLLIDEAQDTSTMQWQLIELLTHNFFCDSTITESIFIVGDFKQSIYGFHGAYPTNFLSYKTYFKARIDPSKFLEIDLNINFRSQKALVNFSTTLCNLNSIIVAEQHIARPGDGTVLCLAPPSEIIGSVKHYALYLANYIELNFDENSDLMILFRNRDELYQTLVSELNRRCIKFIHDQPIKVQEHSICKDILSFLKFLYNPHDDFNLCSLLQSSFLWLLGRKPFDAKEIQDICLTRTADVFATLESSLSAKLIEYIQRAHLNSVFDLIYELITGAHRNYWLSCYPRHSEEILNFFLGEIYNLEESCGGSSYLIHDHFQTQEVIYKPKLENQKNTKRIMTIHGSKGLQAETVLLIDFPRHNSHDAFLWSYSDSNVCFFPPSNMYFPIIENLRKNFKKENEEENERLLYVALTRAENNLIIAPYLKNNGLWYEQLSNLELQQYQS